MDVRGVCLEPVLVKRKDDLIVLDLPRTGFYSVGTRPRHKVAAVVVVDFDGVGELVDGDVVPGLGRLAGQEFRREGAVETRSGRRGLAERLGVVLVSIEIDCDVRGVPIDLNRRRRLRRLLGVHRRSDAPQAKRRDDGENRAQDEAYGPVAFIVHCRTHQSQDARNLCRHTPGIPRVSCIL